MSFTAEWLAMREPHDTQSRSRALVDRLASVTAFRSTLTVLDLGSGTGSMMRHLAPHIRPPQHWLLADHDPNLLALAEPPGLAVTAETRVVDLVLDLGELPWETVDLVTASALLDLVSAHWLDQLFEHCLATNAGLYAALNYDGRIAWAPAHTDDGWITGCFNRHQTTDKGFGPALGPACAEQAADLYRHANWLVDTASSDWRLTPSDTDIQRALIDGIAGAARAVVGDRSSRISDWQAWRLEAVAEGRSHLTVGHTDLLALPAELGG
ncbi:MAG: class I SAM-dependent methyltransferase [Pseudomonadota bacterium]